MANPMIDTTPLDNGKVMVTYRRSEKQIFARDLTDANNEPACYTKSKRGLDKAWLALVELHKALGPSMTHRDVMNTFTQCGIRYHYWCMMD